MITLDMNKITQKLLDQQELKVITTVAYRENKLIIIESWPAFGHDKGQIVSEVAPFRSLRLKRDDPCDDNHEPNSTSDLARNKMGKGIENSKL